MVEKLSIVIPAYNEEFRLGRTLDELHQLLPSLPCSVEVVVVDDGSLDATVDVARKHLAPYPESQLVAATPNRGKGYAVREGMLAATGDLRLFMDADGSTDLGEIARFLERMDTAEPPDILIASIAVSGATVDPQPLHRQIAGRSANRLIRITVLPGFHDTQRGFKLFTARAAEDIFSRCQLDGWLFDVEALALGRRLGYRTEEIGVTWEHREDSRVTARSYGATLADLFTLRMNLWRGTYGSLGVRARQPV